MIRSLRTIPGLRSAPDCVLCADTGRLTIPWLSRMPISTVALVWFDSFRRWPRANSGAGGSRSTLPSEMSVTQESVGCRWDTRIGKALYRGLFWEIGLRGWKRGLGTRAVCESVGEVSDGGGGGATLGGAYLGRGPLGRRGAGILAKIRGLTSRLEEESWPCMSVLQRCSGEDINRLRFGRGGLGGGLLFSELPMGRQDEMARREDAKSQHNCTRA